MHKLLLVVEQADFQGPFDWGMVVVDQEAVLMLYSLVGQGSKQTLYLLP